MSRHSIYWLWLTGIVVWWVPVPWSVPIVRGAGTGEAFFEQRIRPLLVERCIECHGPDATEGGLRLDSAEALLRGGDRGPAIVPGKPEESLLILAVRHGELLQMPPKRKLPTRAIADLEAWVRDGAVWPGPRTGIPPKAAESRTPATAEAPAFTREQREHWAFLPRQYPRLPDSAKDPQRDSREGRAAPAETATPADHPIDRFLDSARRSRGLTAAPPASRAQLIRRASLDLTGILPTPDELDAFLADERPDAWERLLDRLLASPRYGERWGRHWLDVARYADSNGLDENLAFAHAYRYRDYVIGAWNRDLPFDQFIREQLAGDLLPEMPQGSDATERLIATGFLSLGAKMLAEDDPVKLRMDILDEQVDTIGRVFCGLTLGCARCHDHKYDPFTMTDYYGLAGIFASTKTMETYTVVARWLERPLGDPAVVATRTQLEARIRALNDQERTLTEQASAAVVAEARRHVGDYLLAAWFAEQLAAAPASPLPTAHLSVPPAAAAILLEAEQFDRGNVLRDTTNYGSGIGVLVNRGETPNFTEYEVTVSAPGYYHLDVRYAAAQSRPVRVSVNGVPALGQFAADVTGGWQPEHQAWRRGGILHFAGGKNVLRLEQRQAFPHLDQLLLRPLQIGFTPLRVAPSYEPLPEWVESWRRFLSTESTRSLAWAKSWQERVAAGNTEALLALARELQADEQLGRLLPEGEAGPFPSLDKIESRFSAAERTALATLRDERRDCEQRLPKLPEAMAVQEDTPQDLRIHWRGSHLTLGPVVSRRFPVALPENRASISPSASGRRELAEWLADPEHPLTARVIVNRVWQGHFGAGLVRSPDNFGLLGERPSHPELLDWLANECLRGGWSLKHLHRLIMTSAAYQRSSQQSPREVEVDPENLWCWRFPRRRMEAEVLRDSILAVTGQLDERMGGSLLPTENRKYVTSTANVNPVVYDSRRRSVYLPVVRSALYEVFQAFDFADPNVSQGRRETTTVAPQALFLMNSRVVAENTEAWAAKLLASLESAAPTKLASPSSAEQQLIAEMYRRAFSRQPSATETARAQAYLADYRSQVIAAGRPAAEALPLAWRSLARALLSTNEFVYWE